MCREYFHLIPSRHLENLSHVLLVSDNSLILQLRLIVLGCYSDNYQFHYHSNEWHEEFREEFREIRVSFFSRKCSSRILLINLSKLDNKKSKLTHLIVCVCVCVKIMTTWINKKKIKNLMIFNQN